MADVVIRWTHDRPGDFCAGDVVIQRAEWDIMTERERLDRGKTLVGRRIVEVLDIDYVPVNARWDDPMVSEEVARLEARIAAAKRVAAEYLAHTEPGERAEVPVDELLAALNGETK